MPQIPADHASHGFVRVAILTVSDTRTEADDLAGDAIAAIVADAGHAVGGRAIVRDEAAQIVDALEAVLADDATPVCIVTGGTGITPRDVTPEAVEPLFTKPLVAFGALFAQMSAVEVGSSALLSRATAGIVTRLIGGSTAVFCLPGSVKAVQLATRELIAPQLNHLDRQMRG